MAAKDKETFDAFNLQLLEEFPVVDIGDLSWYLGCAFEHDNVKGAVDSLAERFDIQ